MRRTDVVRARMEGGRKRKESIVALNTSRHKISTSNNTFYLNKILKYSIIIFIP